MNFTEYMHVVGREDLKKPPGLKERPPRHDNMIRTKHPINILMEFEHAISFGSSFQSLRGSVKKHFFFTSFSSILIYYSEHPTTDLCASQLLYFFTLRTTKTNRKL